MTPQLVALVAEYGPLLKDCSGEHRWKFMGGCACPSGICRGHAVHQCEVCGDWDYGRNPESDRACAEYAAEELA